MYKDISIYYINFKYIYPYNFYVNVRNILDLLKYNTYFVKIEKKKFIL